MKRKKNLWLPAFFLLATLIAGCQNDTIPDEPKEAKPPASSTVSLTVWGAEEDQELLSQIIEGFEIEYQQEADFEITLQPQGESQCTNVLMGDLENGADVFAFADDQLNTLVAAGALEPIGHEDAVRASNLPEAVAAASVNDTLYAYPLTADNGYFLYYNSQYFSKEDVQSWDKMLEIAAGHNKKISMDWSSGWYVYSLFGNTGLTVGLNDDGITNYCTWNSTKGKIQGIDVAKAMVRMAKNPGFLSTDDAGFLEGVQNGTVIAGISGTWNAMAVEEAWGKGYSASKLPTYTCAGQQVQMASFSGFKLIGVNAYSEEQLPNWRSGLPMKQTKSCASSSGGRGLRTPMPQLQKKCKAPRPLQRCWNSQNFPPCSVSEGIFGIRSLPLHRVSLREASLAKTFRSS